MRRMRDLLRDNTAVTSIEYGLIAALIALGVLTAVNTIGARISNVLTALASPASPPPGGSGNGP